MSIKSSRPNLLLPSLGQGTLIMIMSKLELLIPHSFLLLFVVSVVIVSLM